MSATASQVSSMASKGLPLAQAKITGKIQAERENGDFFYTRMILPSADEFSSAPSVEVRSDRRIGKIDEVVNLTVAIAGYNQTRNGIVYNSVTLNYIDKA